MLNLINQKKFISILMITIAFSQITTSISYSQRRTKFRRSQFQPGDAVRISIIEVMHTSEREGTANFNINDEYSISREGTIFMPLVGKIKVAGYNQESLIELLAQKFSPYFKEPFITVTPLIRLTLMGAFNKPGSYRIDPNASLWELIKMAEGPTSSCDLNSLRVERGGEVVMKDLLSSFERGYSLKEIGVRSGDQIMSNDKRHFGLKEILDYTRFGISLIILYLQIQYYKG